MKSLLFSLLLVSPAWASAPGVALEEAMALSQPVSREKAPATTSIVLRLINPQGEKVNLVEKNAKLLVRPASLMKLFTGWMAFELAVRPDDFLSEMLHRSDNAKAEQTLKALGGAKSMMSYYREQGLPVDGALKIVDGSGLSKSNRVNCDVVIQHLERIKEHPESERFKTLLASPGEVGTLDDRLLEYQGRLFGKTGTLRTTIALAGLLESPKGTVLFCVISEYFRSSWPQERARVDGLLRNEIQALEAETVEAQ